MRSLSQLTLLAAAALAACSTNPPVDEWTRVQRERLERARSQRSPQEALAEVIAKAPKARGGQGPGSQGVAPAGQAPQGQNPQDPGPRYIDQREPQGPGGGVRPYRTLPPPLTVRATAGLGQVKAKGRGTLLDDSADAMVGGLQIESGSGAALYVDAWQSETELFNGVRINDGVAPAAADARLSGIDVFPHIRFDPLRGALTLPVRVGMFGEWQDLEHDVARVQRDFLSIGPRVALEPTLRLFGDANSSLSLWGRVGGDVGIAWFNERFSGGDEGDRALRWGGELGGGLRGQLGAFSLDAGWRLNQAWFGDTDTALYGDRSGTELQRQQVFLGFGFTY